MNSPSEYFGRISHFGASKFALVLMLIADIAFTALHVWQEWKGERFPLYRAFGAIVGLWFPRFVGFIFFTGVLAVALWTAGVIAYAGWQPILGMVSTAVGVSALGLILGARLG